MMNYLKKAQKEELEIVHFTSDELKSIIENNTEFQCGIRLFACYQITRGASIDDVASFYSISHKRVRDWVMNLNKGGIEGIIDQEAPATITGICENKVRLMREILLEKKPCDYGFNCGSWTWATLKSTIAYEFQISYKRACFNGLIREVKMKFIKYGKYLINFH